MLPSIFGENLFDDFFSDPFGMMAPQGRDPLYGKHAKNLMKTDVRETEDSYELDIDLPGFKKDEVSVELKNGCLTIQAAKGLDKGCRGRADGAVRPHGPPADGRPRRAGGTGCRPGAAGVYHKAFLHLYAGDPGEAGPDVYGG